MERDPDPRADSPPAPAGRPVVAGLFTEREAAVAAIDDLQAAGFAPDDVGVAMRDRSDQGDLAQETGTQAAGGAATGALGGGLLGGALGLLVGLGALAIPGVGPVLAGGMLATAFGLGGGTAVAGAGLGAAAGGIVGALVGMGIPEAAAEHFEEGFRAGGVLVTVDGGDRAPDAAAVLRRHGADLGGGAAGAS
jgi:Heat induced stress protein YflT